MLGCTKSARAVPSIERAVLEPGAEGLQQGAAGGHQRQVDLVDQVAPGVAVAGQRALGQQVAAGDRSRCVRPAAGGAVGRERGAGRGAGVRQVGGHRSDDDRAVAEVLEQPRRGLERVGRPRRARRPAGHPAWRTARPCRRRARSGVRTRRRRAPPGAGARRRAPRRRRRGRPTPARWRATARSRRPRRARRRRRRAPRAGRPRRRGTPRRGRRPRRWRRRPRGRRAAPRRAPGRVLGVEQRVDVGLHDPDAQPHQLDGLLQRDDAGELARRGAEDDHVERVVAPGLDLDVVPLDEAADAGLDDQPDPRAVLGAEVVEPGQVGRHPPRGGGAERTRTSCAAPRPHGVGRQACATLVRTRTRSGIPTNRRPQCRHGPRGHEFASAPARRPVGQPRSG